MARGVGMVRGMVVGLALLVAGVQAQETLPQSHGAAFEVATIKQVDPGAKDGRYLRMENEHRFIAKNYTVKLLLAAAYDLSPRAISGGPGWMEADHYTIEAVTPGSVRPGRDEQMLMLRQLITERFQLKFVREPREFSIYVLSVAKGGPKLKATADASQQTNVVSTVYPEKIVLPARNASMRDFTLMMQRAIFDRPVVDRTGLTGKYDFTLEWAPDETQFGGEIPANEKATSPPLFVALQEQLGLRLEPTKGMIDAMVVTKVERPEAN